MNPEFSSATEKAPKINFPPKPALVSTLPAQPGSPSLSERTSVPPTIPTAASSENSSAASKKLTSFSPSLPLLLISFGIALLAFALQLWLFF